MTTLNHVKEELLIMAPSFSVGNKVKLVQTDYGDTPSNPIWNGTYGCIVGVIESIDSSSIEVDWENGEHNGYFNSDLRHVVGEWNEENNS